MRTFSFGTPSTPATRPRRPNTPCEPTRSVQRSCSGSYSAVAERGSIGQTTMRLLSSSSRVTCAAPAKAAATAARSPVWKSSATLPGALS